MQNLLIALFVTALALMNVRAIRISARHRDAERLAADLARRLAEAESAAADAWSNAYQAGASEQYVKLEREIASSYDKGFESGWNTCVIQFEDRPGCKEVAAA